MIQSQSDQARPPLTVSELAFEIRRRLQPLAAVLVKGEVSGMKALRNGHYGFTIRDRGAVWMCTELRDPNAEITSGDRQHPA